MTSRRKATTLPFALTALDLSTNYEDFGNDKIPDQEIDDMQRAPGGTASNKEDELDKTGVIFKLFDKEAKVCLPSLGSYVKFKSLRLHIGFKDGEVKTNLSAQLFSGKHTSHPRGSVLDRTHQMGSVVKYEEHQQGHQSELATHIHA